MAITALELRKRAKNNYTQMQDILNSATETLSAEEEQRFEKLDKEMESLLAQAKKIEDFEKKKLEEEEAMEIHDRNKKPNELTAEQKKEAEAITMREYLRTGSVPEELKGFMKKAKAEAGDSDQLAAELKKLGISRAAQQSTADAAGGYTIPEGFQAEIDKGVK